MTHYSRSQSSPSAASSAGILINSAVIISMFVLIWINYVSRPDNASMMPFSTIPTDGALALPTTRILARTTNNGEGSMLRTDKTNEINSDIVTYYDTRKQNEAGLLAEKRHHKQKHEQQQQQQQDKPKKSLHDWRETYNRQCQDARVSREDVLKTVQRMYEPPTASDVPHSSAKMGTAGNAIVEPCQYTFLDFGANVGDSLGKFIDSGIDNCDKNGFEFTPKYNLAKGVMDDFYERENILVRFARHVTRKAGRRPIEAPPRYPEQYCYFGVEGNPVFTDKLNALEDRMMAASPRPVKSAHFFTETVGAGVDGPAVLYLDTISTDKNYWGSSVLTQPKFVRQSAEKHNNGKPIEAKVQGRTLSSLVRQTVLPQKDAHLLIKMDIEGGEYAVLQEVHKSGVLCDYIKKGVIVTMILEKHTPQFEAAKLDMGLWSSFMKDLRQCGVSIQGGMSAG